MGRATHRVDATNVPGERTHLVEGKFFKKKKNKQTETKKYHVVFLDIFFGNFFLYFRRYYNITDNSNNGEMSGISVSASGDTLATHGRGGAMRGRRQAPEILITRPPTAAVKQGKCPLMLSFLVQL